MNALDIAESIAERIERSEPLPTATTFGAGAAGNALFFLALAQARSTDRWARAAHQSLKLAATGGQATLPGLFSGLAGLLFVTSYATRIEPRYASLRDQCAKALVASGATSAPLEPASRARDYDLISGVAGLHAALLYGGFHNEARTTREYLQWILADDERWKCEHELAAERGRAHDLGIAHGLAGMLSVLAADDEAAAQTLERGAEFLWHARIEGTTLWPSSIGAQDAHPSRAAWCYGNPGIGMALLRVGQRTQSSAIIEGARAAFHAVIDAPRDSWGQIDDALCHGAAGNALIFHTAGAVLGDLRVASCASDLTGALVDRYDDAEPFGYRNFDNLRDCWSDDPTLLTGAAGIGLALVTMRGGIDTSWTCAFAIPEATRMEVGAA